MAYLAIRVDSELVGERVVVGVAGVGDRVMDVDGAVVSVAMMEEAVGAPSTSTIDLHVLRDAFLKASNGHEDFECRARRQLSLDSFVHQGAVWVCDELIPVGAVDADGEGIGIEAGPRDHGEDVAIPGIHGHDCAAAASESELGGALKIVVDGQLEVLARDRMLNSEIADLTAVAVHNDVPRPVLPAQKLVIGFFNTGLAHHVSGLVIGEAGIVQVLFADFTNVPDEVCGVAVSRIEAALFVDGFELGQLVAVGFDECPLVWQRCLV